MAAPLHVSFLGDDRGEWRVVRQEAVVGEDLAPVARVAIEEGAEPQTRRNGAEAWILRGVTGHQRYVERREAEALRAVQAGLGRAEATCAALIPIRKSSAWWELAQDERRAIFEERSQHIAATLRYLPAIARRLHHARELGEPFDFITWFELAPVDVPRFDELVGLLRATEEWRYVEREVDLRLMREQ